MTRKRKALAIVLVAIAAAVTAVYATVGNPLDPFDDRRFSASAWRAGDHDRRARMARDAIRAHLRPGTSEQQVVALLGVGEEREVSTARRVGARSLVYYLGSWPTRAATTRVERREERPIASVRMWTWCRTRSTPLTTLLP
jgi:hypothetical protein